MIYSDFIDNYSDTTKFEKWKTKVDEYRKKLNNSTVKEYEIDSSMIPQDIDASFNATVIPQKVMNKEDFWITSLPAFELAQKIANSEISATETFRAFAKRATIANQFTNYAMEFFIEEGLRRAQELDSYFKKTGKVVGPLHGLPISLKEHYSYKNRITHASYVSLLDNITPQHAVTVQNLHEAGAIFYVRTTGPQSLMHLDSCNNIIGRGRNPNNLALGPGGSSSGEGIVVAMGGSSMGVGTDIGGSIRAPAAFCGCWALRPTQKRISTKGCIAAISGFEGVVCVMGPIARYAQDIDFWMKSVIAQKPWTKDCDIIPLPWREVERPMPTKLKIGIMYEDGIVKPHPPIERGLRYVELVLQKNGIVIDILQPHRALESLEVVNTFYSSDSNKGQLSLLGKSGEPLLPLTKWAMGFGKGTDYVSAEEYRNLTAVRDSIRNDYMVIMDREDIDFILSPVYVGVAPKPSKLHYWGYTALWNLIDMPNLVFPTGLAQDPKIDKVNKEYTTRSEIEEYEYRLYDNSDDFIDAPICLQLTGRRYHDEELVKFGEVLEKMLQQP